MSDFCDGLEILVVFLFTILFVADHTPHRRRSPETKSRSDPDSKQKTETELTFWYVLPYFVQSETFQSKQTQKQGCTSRM